MPLMLIGLLKYWKVGVFGLLIAAIVVLHLKSAHEVHEISDLKAQITKKDAIIASDHAVIEGFDTQVRAVQTRAQAEIGAQKVAARAIELDYESRLTASLATRRAIVVPKACPDAIKYANQQAVELGKW